MKALPHIILSNTIPDTIEGDFVWLEPIDSDSFMLRAHINNEWSTSIVANADYSELQKLLANKADLSVVNEHISNSNIHVTASDKLLWNNKASKTDVQNINDTIAAIKDASLTLTIDGSTTKFFSGGPSKSVSFNSAQENKYLLSVEKESTDTDNVYVFRQGYDIDATGSIVANSGKVIGEINIAKDMFVESGKVTTITGDATLEDGTYLVLQIRGNDDPIYINTKDLGGSTYSVKQVTGSEPIALEISSENVISATLQPNTIDSSHIKSGSITGDDISNGTITISNLSTEVQNLISSTLDAVEVSISKEEVESNVYTQTTADVYTTKTKTGEDESGNPIYTNGVDFQLTYSPTVPTGAKTYAAIGGISAGTDVSTLTGLPLSDVISKMLFKNVSPTYTRPTMSIRANSTSVSSNGTVPIWYGASSVPMVVTYNKNDGGNPDVLQITVTDSNGVQDSIENGFGGTTSISTNLVSTNMYSSESGYTNTLSVATVLTYTETGRAEKTDSYGNIDLTGAISAGSLSMSFKIKPVLPYIYFNGSSLLTSSLAESYSYSNSKTIYFTVSSFSNNGVVALKVPYKMTSAYSKDVQGNYTVNQTSSFVESTEENTDYNYTYYVYSWNAGACGKVEFKFTTA